jgi:hypothetical protein
MMRIALCLLLFAAVCEKPERAGLMVSGQALPLVVHLEKAADPQELGRIVRMPVRDIATRLGALRAVGTSFVRMSTGELLDQTLALDVDPRGDWHALRENSREQGVEVWASANELVVKMRYGKAVKRRAEGNESERLREDLAGDAAAYYDLVERFTKTDDAGMIRQAGRSARKVRLSLRRSAGSAPKDTPEWRKELKLDELDGNVIVDEKTGAPLLVELQAHGSYPKGVIELRLRREIQQVGGVAAIVAPVDAIDSPTRTRYELEKRELLEGLAVGNKAGSDPPPHSGKSDGRR